jgi:hypothetical protein
VTSPPPSSGGGRIVRPPVWRTPDRHILLGVSHPTDDPALHRVFEVRASYDEETGDWRARVAEQNLNEQREDWGPKLASDAARPRFSTAASCLGDAVATLVAIVDEEARSADS